MGGSIMRGGQCFGTFDPESTACTKQCAIGSKCRRFTEIKNKGKDGGSESLSPLAKLVDMLRTNHDVEEVQAEDYYAVRWKKGDDTYGMFSVDCHGIFQAKTTDGNVKIELVNGICNHNQANSVRQILENENG